MCFSLQWIGQILIWAVIIGATIAIIRLIVPWALARAGVPLGEGWAMLVQVFMIVIYAIIAIFVIIVVFDAIACLWSWAGGFPRIGR